MAAYEVIISFFKLTSVLVVDVVVIYAVLLGLLTTTAFQPHMVYLHALQMPWFKDLNVPQLFGFLPNQVTPFSIKTPDGEIFYAWHIIPVELYRKHELSLVAEPIGFTFDITSRLSFKLLQDPEASLVIHMHGAGGPSAQNIESRTTVRCLQTKLKRSTSWHLITEGLNEAEAHRPRADSSLTPLPSWTG